MPIESRVKFCKPQNISGDSVVVISFILTLYLYYNVGLGNKLEKSINWVCGLGQFKKNIKSIFS